MMTPGTPGGPDPDRKTIAITGSRAKSRGASWARFAATFFGIGYLRPGPGTWGSVAALLLWLVGAYSAAPTPTGLAVATLAASLLALAVGIPAATLVERAVGGTDPQFVVLDEVAGQWLALAPAAFASGRLWLHGLVALAFFRLFDITKPPPARQLERLHGGAGIMLDDMAAGAYAALVLLLVQHWW